MKTHKTDTADALRERAEALLAKSPEAFQPEDIKSINRLAHELAVHQAELELQNEELRDTQEALEQSRDRFASLFDRAPVGYVVLDASGVIRQTNATWGHMLGRPNEDFRGRAFAETLVDEDAPIFLARFRTFFRNPAGKRIAARVKRRGASPFHARIEVQPRSAQSGHDAEDPPPNELLVIVSDISELQKARVEIETRNAELGTSNKRLDHINRVLLGIRNVNQLIVAEDDPHRLIERACANLTGTMGYHNAWIVLLGGEAARGLGFPDAGPVAAAAAHGFNGRFGILRERLERGEFPECVKRALERACTVVTHDPSTDCSDCPLHGEYDGRAGLVRRLDFDGVTYGILTASVPAAYADDAEEQHLFNDMAVDLAFALHKIATDRRLEETRQHLGLVIEGSGLGTWEWNVQTNETLFNERWAAMLGYTIQELTPYDYTTWERLVHPEDLDRARRGLTDCIAGRTIDYRCEFRMRHKDGHWVWICDRGCIMTRDEAGRPLSMFGTHTDITGRKQVEQALLDSENRVRAKLDALLDPEGDLEALNLADVVDCDQIQSLMNDFHALTDIGMAIIDLEGNVLVGTGWQDVCTKFHRVHPDAARNCRESDTLLASGVEPGTFKVYKCKNNMWDMVTPIMIGERHLGNLFLGQFFFEDEAPDLDVFREQARRYGFDEDAYLKAYQRIPRWSRQTVHEVMTFYCNLIGVISRLSHAHIKLAQTSESLRQSEQRFRSFVENANDIVYAVSLEGLFTYISPNWLEFMGEPAEQAIGKSFESYVHPEDVHLCRAFLEKTLKSGEKQSSVEYRVRHQDGSWRWHASKGSPVRDESGTVTGYVGIGRDITEAKRAEEALKASEMRFKEMLQNVASVAVQGYAMDGTVRYWNRTSETFYGYTGKEALGRNLLDLIIPPALREGVKAEMRRMIETGEAIPAGELELMRKDGSSIQVYSSHTLVQVPGQDLELFCVDIDLSERKQAEEALVRQQRSINLYNRIAKVFLTSSRSEVFADVLDVLRKTLDSRFGYFGYIDEAGDLVCPSMTHDVWEQCRVTEKSIVFPRTGWGGLWGRSLLEKRTLVANENLRVPEGHVALENALATPIIYNDNLIGQFVLAGKAGGYNQEDRDLLENAAAQTAPILFAFQEEARRKTAHEKLQAQLRQAQKMEAVGRLAGGVAHDFNNMLGIIIGYADVILEEMDRDHPFYADLAEIKKAGMRSADLTRQLLAFARKQTVAPKVLNINETVASMLKMLGRLIGEDIEMAFVPGEKVWPVRIDPGQIDQMLANLCVNARDAIAGVGKVTIETDNTVLDEDYCRFNAGFVPGEYVMLAVSDNGCGMDAETLSHLFEPFFTTKELGKGTGLGLATVYGVVKQNNGFINVYSEPGQGTTFRIYLPRHKTKAKRLPERAHVTSAGSGHETILLVEDEPAILKMTGMMLEREGYTVVRAGTPGEAIRLAHGHTGTIHLLISDVVMPEMNGRDLAKNILSLSSDTKCLFMSGYTANVIAHHGVLDKGVHFIQKPFSRKDLLVKVRDVLDRE